jgi:aarF domain-containing kinase
MSVLHAADGVATLTPLALLCPAAQEAIARQGLDIIKLVDIGINCSLRQLLEHGFFHADPHPGNLLATPDGRLAFLDFGMMSETPPTARCVPS